MPRLSISTWSLDKLVGKTLPLLDVPAACAAHKISTLELCHFHFPRTDDAYLDELAAAATRAKVELFSVLIDDGDITQPDPAQRAQDIAEIERWIGIASRLGAAHARVVAGQAQPGEAAIALSAAGLSRLRDFGRARKVEVITENFGKLTVRAAPLAAISKASGVRLCADFGNFSGPSKHDDLAAILPFAASAHVKALHGPSGALDRDELRRGLDLAQAAGFDGPYSLIHEGPGDPWPALATLAAEVRPYG